MSEIVDRVSQMLAAYDPLAPEVTAGRLRALWLEFDPKSIAVIKAEQRAQQETVGIPVPVLKEIGQTMAKVARKRASDFAPLMRLLWESYGREGRVVAVHPLGAMVMASPETMLPFIIELCRTCLTWEDADQLAMNALEPIVRKNPEQWLPFVEPWLEDESKWVRRAGVTVVGRLPMKNPTYTTRCLELTERVLYDEDTDVKKAVSFAIRIAARGDFVPVCDYLARHVPPANSVATWVLCDAIRSMGKALLPEFASLLPHYEQWIADPALNPRDRRSVESAVQILQRV